MCVCFLFFFCIQCNWKLQVLKLPGTTDSRDMYDLHYLLHVYYNVCVYMVVLFWISTGFCLDFFLSFTLIFYTCRRVAGKVTTHTHTHADLMIAGDGTKVGTSCPLPHSSNHLLSLLTPPPLFVLCFHHTVSHQCDFLPCAFPCLLLCKKPWRHVKHPHAALPLPTSQESCMLWCDLCLPLSPLHPPYCVSPPISQEVCSPGSQFVTFRFPPPPKNKLSPVLHQCLYN